MLRVVLVLQAYSLALSTQHLVVVRSGVVANQARTSAKPFREPRLVDSSHNQTTTWSLPATLPFLHRPPADNGTDAAPQRFGRLCRSNPSLARTKSLLNHTGLGCFHPTSSLRQPATTSSCAPWQHSQSSSIRLACSPPTKPPRPPADLEAARGRRNIRKTGPFATLVVPSKAEKSAMDQDLHGAIENDTDSAFTRLLRWQSGTVLY